jgi:predicted GIY-YIG superfamily endonuclease
MTTNQILYRYYDKDDNLLYIGISSNFQARAASHSKFATWSKKASTVKLEHYPDRHSVLAAEKYAIMTEKPLHNVIHNKNKSGPEGHWQEVLSGELEDDWHLELYLSLKKYELVIKPQFEVADDVFAAFALRGTFFERSIYSADAVKGIWRNDFIAQCEGCDELNRADFFNELNIRYWGRLKGELKKGAK